MTPEERELKNKRISESIKATREKRRNQRAIAFAPLPAYWWRLTEFKPLDSVNGLIVV